MGKKIFNRKEVEAAIPRARLLAANRLGLPIQYSELDLVNAFYNYINGYNVDPMDKEQMLSLDNIRWALDYLNSFGHNQKNLDFVIQGIYNAPRNKRLRDAQQRNSKNNKNNREDGYSGLGENLIKFTTGVIDVPRRALASFLHHGTEDGRYDASQVLNIMDERSTPVTGLEYAREYPILSALIDIGASAGLSTLASLGTNATKNALSYAGRQQLTGFLKSKALLQIQNNTIPMGTEYEVIRTIKPSSTKTSSNYFYELGGQGGTKLTGTKSPATGRPYTKGNIINDSKVVGQQIVTNGLSAADDVYTWTYAPWTPFTIPGIPLFVPGIPQVSSAQTPIPYTIVEETPNNYDDSDIINALGAKEGDIIHMPDGRVIKYTTGGTESRGKLYDYTNVREYDRHNNDVKKQPNVPDRTRNEDRQSSGKKVKVEQRKNPNYMQRDYNNYYPEIIPINYGKNNN